MTTSPELLAAYLATDYCVSRSGDPPITLRIGQRCGAVAAMFQVAGERTALFITAYNPFSVPTSDVENQAAHAHLRDRLLHMTKRVRSGEGRARDGAWPPEPSFMALGIDYDTACALGREFCQNAIVFVGADAVPALVILSAGPSGG